MKLTIERAALLKSLGHVQSVVERRNTIPILSNVKIDAGDASVRLNATDMDLDIVEAATADVSTPGSTTVSAHTLYDIVRKLPDGAQIDIDAAGDGQVVLSAGRSRFTLASLPTDEFPVLSGGELPHQFTLSAAELRGLIDRTRFAISTEETRYYLNGIYLHKAESDGTALLRAVATDGHRLASVEVPLPAGAEEVPGVIVPRKAVAELRKLIDESGDEVAVSMSESKIRFAFDDAVLTSKLIDGTFPDYQRVIPAGNDKVMEVECKSFADAVDRVSAISSEKSRAIKLALSGGTLVLSASSPEHGSATEEIEVAFDGDELEIGFNSAYLLDVTRQIEGEMARFTMADAASPTVMQETDDTSALYVLMPMRV
ncbi:MAG: DNA polymerase III subunit beta [Rhodospirillaceae bacterium]|jgi:DNA polymerase III subunit beta|nr:DNA polymerase III subunit beta [Rhodospirillaceae bacterium]MBT5298449.1 DNA polymerase III subunit beta [Rhodospirillaceae bacterium]MBT5515782.1 DNA polymerase III subunit beta [Rhodospirillaceae bacterium]MBT6607367.1 DNA polymerase III subunit beta [Rhodospirillaceae bacterium]MBT6885439.1 DNA polymerase III subunit beta [Rhodospirillaceae bacterium]